MTPGSSAWRATHWGNGCDPAVIVTAPWILGAPSIQCHQAAAPAFRALGRVVRRHGYHVRGDETGCYNCRPITGGTVPSAHAQGIALDVNWNTNPYRRDRLVTDMARAMIDAGEAIVTDAGVVVFRWGGDWDGRPETPQSNYDAMHWEVIATPGELAAGFALAAFDESDTLQWPLLVRGDRGQAVAQLQAFMAATGALAMPASDSAGWGRFGPLTMNAVVAFQKSRALKADGVVGLGTWTALLTDQPPVPDGQPSPIKVAA